MKGYLSIIKYYPDNNRDEGFGIGLILISEDGVFSKIKTSTERYKRINSAFGKKKSYLIDFSINEFSKKNYNKCLLDYLSVYENGNLRFTKPQTIISDDLISEFDPLYSKYIADYSEKDFLSKNEIKGTLSSKLNSSFRKKFRSNKTINEKLNIGYEFKEDSISKFLIGNPNIDFIGGNGVIFSGEIINLDLNEDSIQKSLFKTITLFEALDKTFSPFGKFDPKECKMLVLQEQANAPQNFDYMERLNTWSQKADYELVVKKSIEDFEADIEKRVIDKNIIRFDEWINKPALNLF
jgi:hypothetical protein